ARLRSRRSPRALLCYRAVTHGTSTVTRIGRLGLKPAKQKRVNGDTRDSAPTRFISPGRPSAASIEGHSPRRTAASGPSESWISAPRIACATRQVCRPRRSRRIGSDAPSRKGAVTWVTLLIMPCGLDGQTIRERRRRRARGSGPPGGDLQLGEGLL